MSLGFSSMKDLCRLFRRSRQFSTFSRAARSWRNETPTGSLTELYVYSPESSTVWPDPRLSVFGERDPRFPFPGNIGPAPSTGLKSEASAVISSSPEEALNSSTKKEVQIRTLASAKEYIKYSSDSESHLCRDILEEFPKLPGVLNLKCELHEAPTLLKQYIQPMFPEKPDLSDGALSVISISQKTEFDMSKWSEAMEGEREKLASDFVDVAKEICARMAEEGYWADFVDPVTGAPYFGGDKSVTMLETNENFRLLGFRIEDLGCCKVLHHREFGKNVFVGVIFSNVHPSHGVIQDMFQELKMSI